MHPVLFKLGSVTLYTYGLFVGLGFILALFFAIRNAAEYDLRAQYTNILKSGRNLKSDIRNQISDLFFVILVSAIIGARLFYVFLNLSYFADDPLAVFKIWNGGLVFYGGFIGALAAGMIYVRRKKLNLWFTADIIAPAIALGHAVGRIGCFCAGCCYGKVCDLPWAVTFTNIDSLAPLNVSLHPTQLYSVFSNFFIFLILLFIQKRKKFNGMVFWSYIFLYGIFRSFIEIFRGDPRGHFIIEYVSLSQGIGTGMAFFALFMLFLLYRKKKHGSD
ncbi:MAG: prolipoprotein diacylglyceryl transferase [Thermodesulfobacteriota bacterium]|nr:prolipoprotein diacylglyceryl transferase [Thermodesulfobacteriota bacterium]